VTFFSQTPVIYGKVQCFPVFLQSVQDLRNMPAVMGIAVDK